MNERLFQILYQDQNPSVDPSSKIKMNDDFILVHKSLFEFLYGVYGCDYFILAKQQRVPSPM